jgi:uncharacterized oligopeptide transporter (OPT) family protein
LLAPIITYFKYQNGLPAGLDYAAAIITVWKTYVRPIAIGGMLVGAAYTLWKMRKSLGTGIARSVGDVKKAASGETHTLRTDKDISFYWVIAGILAVGVLTFFIYNYF